MLQQAWVLSKKVPSIEDQSILGAFLFMLEMHLMYIRYTS